MSADIAVAATGSNDRLERPARTTGSNDRIHRRMLAAVAGSVERTDLMHAPHARGQPRATDMIVRTWKARIHAADLDRYVTFLYEVGPRRMASVSGHLGSQLFTIQDGDEIEFTIIAFWEPDSIDRAARLFAGAGGEWFADEDHPFLSAPTTTTRYGQLIAPPVEIGAMASEHSWRESLDTVTVAGGVGPMSHDDHATLVPNARRRVIAGMSAGLAVLVVAISALLAMRPRGDGDNVISIDRSSVSIPDNVDNSNRPIAAAFVPWPDPPVDRDPIVSTRPGSTVTKAAFAGYSLLYVNDIGRPTLVDLSSGDQREVTLARTRQTDSFLVEFGRVVSDDPNDVSHPSAGPRSFRVVVESNVVESNATDASTISPVDANASGAGASPTEWDIGPTLCVNPAGCSNNRWEHGAFTDGVDRVESLETELAPVAVIARFLNATSWSADERWTIYTVGGPDGTTEIRFPTPLRTATIWSIYQPNTEANADT
jgi:hypothetical protein